MQNFANDTGTTKTAQYFDKETEKGWCNVRGETGKIGRATL
jgi:hypothetical protein